MFFRSRRKSSSAPDVAHQALQAYSRVREHWQTCDACRGAAAGSASLWCEVGLRLMSRGVVEDPHWDRCDRCREAQERVHSSQCDLGRDLEREYRALARQLAEA